MILGIDEVGRGPWAGPLVVGAVVLGGKEIAGLADSKKLTKKRREELDDVIKQESAAWALGWVSAEEIDKIGLAEALRVATIRAVEQIKVPYHEIVIDGTINFLADTKKGKYVTTMKKADALVPSVSAASIIAKVARDRFMADKDQDFPGYNFASHVGYGTAEHRAAIEEKGLTDLHRRSFKPISTAEQKTTKSIGNEAETTASQHLESLGHEIIDRNWRTKWCEIDIISSFNDTVYFTEVKYRKNAKGGTGLDAITKNKLSQMKFAADLYAAKHQPSKMLLAVVSLSGKPLKIDGYLEIVEP